MATIHRITEELLLDSFDLIALHSNMECYAMAYHVNAAVQVQLKRAKKDLEIANLTYPIYEYDDEAKGLEWFLVSNALQREEEGESEGLFQNDTTVKWHYLLEERKEINFLLKLNPEGSTDIGKVLQAVRSIPKVSMAYQLDTDNLKSKRNLIF